MRRFLLVLFLPVVALVASAGGGPSETNSPSTIAATVNDPVEQEYRQLIDKDDATMRDVESWIDKPDSFAAAGGGDGGMTMNQRIQQRLLVVKGAYQNFLDKHPNHVRALLAYGSFLNETKDEDGAAEQWEKARKLDPKNPAAWNNLGKIYGHIGPIAKAFEYFGKAIELNTNEPIYYWNLAVHVYLFRKDAGEYYHLDEQHVFDKSIALYHEAMRHDPDNFILASDYAECYYGIRPARWEDGLTAWSQALKIAHDEVEREGVFIHEARIDLQLGRLADAHQWLDRVTNSGYAVLKKRIARNLAAAEHGTNSLASPPGESAPKATK